MGDEVPIKGMDQPDHMTLVIAITEFKVIQKLITTIDFS